MKKNNAAILLNCFVYPGAGHLKLKHSVRGAVFIGITTITCAYLMLWIVREGRSIMTEMVENGASMTTLLGSVSDIKESLYSAPTPVIQYSLVIIVATWIFSIIDIIYLVKKNKVEPDTD